MNVKPVGVVVTRSNDCCLTFIPGKTKDSFNTLDDVLDYLYLHPELGADLAALRALPSWSTSYSNCYGIFDRCLKLRACLDLSLDLKDILSCKLEVGKKPTRLYSMAHDHGGVWYDRYFVSEHYRWVLMYTRISSRFSRDVQPLEPHLEMAMKTINSTHRVVIHGFIEVDPAKDLREQAQAAVVNYLTELTPIVGELSERVINSINKTRRNQ